MYRQDINVASIVKIKHYRKEEKNLHCFYFKENYNHLVAIGDKTRTKT